MRDVVCDNHMRTYYVLVFTQILSFFWRWVMRRSTRAALLKTSGRFWTDLGKYSTHFSRCWSRLQRERLRSTVQAERRLLWERSKPTCDCKQKQIANFSVQPKWRKHDVISVRLRAKTWDFINTSMKHYHEYWNRCSFHQNSEDGTQPGCIQVTCLMVEIYNPCDFIRSAFP